MTKRELLARLTREPIMVQQVAKLARYRVALHDDPHPTRGVWLDLASLAGTLLVGDYAQVYAHLGGKRARLTHPETEAIVSRLRALVVRGGLPNTTGRVRSDAKRSDGTRHRSWTKLKM
jgi:hypothetical protein